MPDKKATSAFQLKHTFAVAGFSCTAIAIIILALFYRHMVVSDIIRQGERYNQLLAQTTLNSVKHELIDFLNVVNYTEIDDPDRYNIPPKLKNAVKSTLSSIFVVRIKIYDRNGTVIYSTQSEHIGQNESNSKLFLSAISGEVASKLEYDDFLSFLHKDTDEDNLVESYLPIRKDQASPILGVIEIYTDVRDIVQDVEDTELLVILGIIIILLVLYGLLLTIVRRTSNTIEHQQTIIEERNQTLEYLSSQLLHSQESEKKALAKDLHENIAQTIAAGKNRIEAALAKLPALNANISTDLNESIQLLQESIRDIRSLAMELRPSSLDDFGIIKTIQWLCRQYHLVYPHISIKTTFGLDDADLSEEQKSVIYRVTKDTLHSIANKRLADFAHVSLSKNNGTILLTIEDNSEFVENIATISKRGFTVTNVLYSMRKRTMLSGGTFTIEVNERGDGTVAKSTWSC